MVRSTLLGLTNKTKPIPTSTVSTISLSSTTRQEGYSSNVIHEHDSSCPHCFLRKSNTKKLYFSVNTANMIRQSNNTKYLMSKPAANSANMSGCLMPMMNLRVKIQKKIMILIWQHYMCYETRVPAKTV